ncbi:unnamed protein product [Kluyveromyces dobzhanskii CBS 2104]|uniref:protein-tyrosine-phosphatase n=1 Tax=Kluyveromyces dobzhanskii CBS 2104 TaxID=1427455 RepID=A0A0A8L9G5_9SACH|nr:unnamed protein product [Kluyveromyces dobzhanskii CBS 2104]
MANVEADITRILGGIYVGGIQPIAHHVPLKVNYQITHILSVIKFEVIPEYLVRKSYTLKNIPIDDNLSTDVLQFFDETNRYIDSCLFPDEVEYDPTKVDFRKTPQKGAIYIHCQAGVSRSVTFAVAYLMYRYRFNLKTALHAVKRKRTVAEPNENFMEQLKLYEAMGSNVVDAENQDYKQWKLQNSIKVDPLGTDVMAQNEMYKTEEAEAETVAKLSKAEAEAATAIRCKKCRFRLALSTSFIKHDPPSKESMEGHFIRRAAGSHRIIDIQESQNRCSHFFMEPLEWMKKELQKQELEGKFFCPHCESKIGGYNWKGSRCSCGKWMIPAIHIQTAKVEQVALTRKDLPNLVSFEE